MQFPHFLFRKGPVTVASGCIFKGEFGRSVGGPMFVEQGTGIEQRLCE